MNTMEYMRSINCLTTTLRQAVKCLMLLCFIGPTVALDQPSEKPDQLNKPDRAEKSEHKSLLSQSMSVFGLGNKSKSKQQPPGPISSRQAAVIAKQHAGGKVLRVRATDNGHSIKMLLPSGKVTYILVGPDGKIKRN